MTTPEKKAGSLPWFRVDHAMVDHPRVAELDAELGEPRSGWYVVRLFAYTMRYHPDGVVVAARAGRADGARTALERACEWRGEPGALFAALLSAGWLEQVGDEVVVHDWAEHQGAAVAKAQKDKERKRASRERRGDGAGTARAGSADGAGNGTERDGTGHSTTTAAFAFEVTDPLAGLKGDEAVKRMESFTKEDFWSRTESLRRSFGWAPEKWPNRQKLAVWWSTARGERDVLTLIDAWVAFARDPHWQKAQPPAPFAGFMAGWNKYLPAKAPAQPEATVFDAAMVALGLQPGDQLHRHLRSFTWSKRDGRLVGATGDRFALDYAKAELLGDLQSSPVTLELVPT